MKTKIRIKAWCPELHPKKDEADMDKLKELYHELYERLNNLEETLEKAKCNKMEIRIVTEDADEQHS